MVNRAFASGLVVLCTAGTQLLLAQSAKFAAEKSRLHQEAVAARAARGVDLLDPVLEKQFPYPVMTAPKVQKLMPGASAMVSVAGKYPPGATVLSERDGAVLTSATQSASSYSARVTVGALEGPGFVKLYAFTPVRHVWTAVPVAFVDAVYRFDLKAANGHTVTVTPTAKSFTVDDKMARLEYKTEFFKPGEKTPFETRVGQMTFTVEEDARTTLDVALPEPKGSAAQELEEISAKMGDPKLTPQQRSDLTVRMIQAQQRMIEEMTKANPAAAQKKADDFGCRILQVYPKEAGAVEGNFACGKNFNGGTLRTTGTMTQVK